MIECRKANPADAETIARTRRIVWQETYAGIYPDSMWEQYDLGFYADRDKARIESGEHTFYLFMDGGECVGYFSYGPYNFGKYKDFDLCLNNLYIRREHKGQGLGRQAFAIVAEYCRQQGIDRFFCGCNAHNHPARAFYRHMGGVEGDVPQCYENPADDIVHYEFYIGAWDTSAWCSNAAHTTEML